MTITHTIDVTEFFPPEKPLKVNKLEVNFIPEWDKENLEQFCNDDSAGGMVNFLLSMDGPAIVFGTVDPSRMIFDYNKMTMGDISHQVNIFFDHIAEQAGDVKGLTNAIYALYLGIIENIITEAK
jgi:hypothetical protein